MPKGEEAAATIKPGLFDRAAWLASGKPLAVDLCSGKGGWVKGLQAAGFYVVAVDLHPFPDNPADQFIRADIQTLGGHQFKGAKVVTASPPCNFYAKLALPASWGANWKPDDGGALWDDAERIIQEIGPVHHVLENVRGAEKVRGKAKKRVGSRYLWGNFPIIDPEPVYGKWRTPPSKDRAAVRSLIPYPLAKAIAEACR